LPGASFPLIDQSGVLEKKIRNFWKIRNLSGTDDATVQRVASSAMRQARNFPKLVRQNSPPIAHQYGLQIAEGMVGFFESYERELEKYWTKTLFFPLS
jgi:hypothetical protein